MRLSPRRQDGNISQCNHQNWLETELIACVVFQIRNGVQSNIFFQFSFAAGVRTRTSEFGGSFESKGGKFTLSYVQETLGLKLQREWFGVKSQWTHLCYSPPLLLQQFTGTAWSEDMYSSQGKSKGPVQSKYKWLCPLPLCQVPELKYTLRSICFTLWSTL